MKKSIYVLISRMLSILLAGYCLIGTIQLHAASKSLQISYSHDQWPTRWSSAIRQQQTGKFPTRDVEENTPDELPTAVFEQDLFESSTVGRRNDRGYGAQKYNNSLGRHFSRNPGRYMRDAAYAYQNSNGPATNYYAGSSYNYPFAVSRPYWNPNMGNSNIGYPNAGFPTMTGLPGVYPMNVVPFIGSPFGFPGNIAMWNPLFAGW